VLNFGTLIAAAVMVAGLGWMMVSGGPGRDLTKFRAEEASVFSLQRAAAGVGDGDASMLALIGVAMLVAIPPLRTVAAGVLFARARDWVFSAMALGVVILLACAMFFGLHS
jgi:uncharacterized membrane protein